MRRRLALFVALLAVPFATFVSACSSIGGGPTITLTAHFNRAPGLYVGNHVSVLGIAVGRIDAVTAGPSDVTVRFTVKRSVAVPADVRAVLMAPGVVNDRFLELDPPYTSGPKMADHGNIPVERSAVPLDTDQIFSSLDQLVAAFGPQGANKGGLFGDTLHQLAGTLDGNGAQLKKLITSVASNLDAASTDAPSLASTLRQLDELTQALVSSDGDYRAFASDVATVTQNLAGDAPQIGPALHSLGITLQQLAGFVKSNRANLTDAIRDLGSSTHAVAQDQKSLLQVFDTGAIGLKNFADTVDSSYPGGPVSRVRYDASGDRAALLKQICGPEEPHLLRIGTFALTGAGATTFDLMCAANSALAQVSPPPGSPQGPDLSLQALLAADG